MAGVLGIGAAAGGFAALQEALGEGAGPQLADGGEFGAELIEAVLQEGGVGRSGHVASYSYSLSYCKKPQGKDLTASRLSQD